MVGGSFNDTKRAPFTAEDIRFTTRGDTLYAIALAWPDNGKVTMTSLSAASGLFMREIAKIELLGSQEALHWTRDTRGLTVDLPARKPCEHAVALRISPVPAL